MPEKKKKKDHCRAAQSSGKKSTRLGNFETRNLSSSNLIDCRDAEVLLASCHHEHRRHAVFFLLNWSEISSKWQPISIRKLFSALSWFPGALTSGELYLVRLGFGVLKAHAG
jgi:hypothetical protein